MSNGKSDGNDSQHWDTTDEKNKNVVKTTMVLVFETAPGTLVMQTEISVSSGKMMWHEEMKRNRSEKPRAGAR